MTTPNWTYTPEDNAFFKGLKETPNLSFSANYRENPLASLTSPKEEGLKTASSFGARNPLAKTAADLAAPKEGLSPPPRLKPGQSFDLAALENVLLWGLNQDLSDLVLTAGQPPWMRRHGVFTAVGDRAMVPGETGRLLIAMTDNEAAASIVGSGRDMDFSYEIGQREAKRRFRGNATAVASGRVADLAISLRAIPGKPPDLDELDLEKDLLAALFPQDGLVLVTGVMGSGKSTLLAAAMRRLAETYGRHVVAYEEPVEFDLSDVKNLKGPVEQTEIPSHLPSFRLAPRNAARRAADVVLLGESRDREALKSLIEAASMGVAAYTTAHSRGVAETPPRLINVFEPRERPAMAAELLSALRLIVQQRLYPKIGGGRVAVREFLALDGRDRRSLQRLAAADLERGLAKILAEKGQSLPSRARELAREGVLSPEIAESLARERGTPI
jgi:defect-in-organelle-trafficking protein DotB